ncbi:MAG: hypothetical protein J6X86_05995 [Bacteroidales bacterium]|nr:hypothetical protein [Bacteroidales bacterium]
MQNPKSKNSVKAPIGRRIFNIVVYLFAIAGFGIIAAWGVYKLGLTKNKGAIDDKWQARSLVSEINAEEMDGLTPQQRNALWMEQYVKLAAFGKFYPENACLILDAAMASNNPMLVDRMLAAASLYTESNSGYQELLSSMKSIYDAQPQQQSPTVIEWMATAEWEMLKPSILKDSALLVEAGRLTGVEPRLIVACLVGEQIRLFNTNREMVKKYLGPVKVLSVQSQFSYGVNGIKEHTARAVEQHLKDSTSVFYMGKQYENILDFKTDNHDMERYNRLVDYRNHLYSYIYTGCILHQTMLQWKRAGFDISDRPDILCTLFNVGFSQSNPHADPRCGGSHVTIDGKIYTFGGIGFDFYYSGDLAREFPFWRKHFIEDSGKRLTQAQIDSIQSNVSNCARPEKGLEYKQNTDSMNLSW